MPISLPATLTRLHPKSSEFHAVSDLSVRCYSHQCLHCAPSGGSCQSSPCLRLSMFAHERAGRSPELSSTAKDTWLHSCTPILSQSWPDRNNISFWHIILFVLPDQVKSIQPHQGLNLDLYIFFPENPFSQPWNAGFQHLNCLSTHITILSFFHTHNLIALQRRINAKQMLYTPSLSANISSPHVPVDGSITLAERAND